MSGTKELAFCERAPGDVCIFDYDELRAQSDYVHPFRPNLGLDYVLVGGKPAVEQGRYTGVKTAGCCAAAANGEADLGTISPSAMCGGPALRPPTVWNKGSPPPLGNSVTGTPVRKTAAHPVGRALAPALPRPQAV